MPSGLQTVLNILQGSATSVGVDDLVNAYPANLDLDRVASGTLQVTMKDTQGRLVKGGKVTITPPEGAANPFGTITVLKGTTNAGMEAEVKKLANGELLNVTKDVIKAYKRRNNGTATAGEGAVTAYTDRKGVVQFLVPLASQLKPEMAMQGTLKIDAMVPVANSNNTEQEILQYTYTIVPATDPQGA